MTGQFAISAHGISKSYGKKRALEDVSIEIEPGRIHVLLGQNGSGKTTLAKILAGALTPDAGTIEKAFLENGHKGQSHFRNLGFLFDSSAHWDSLSGTENAWFYARSFGMDPDEASARIGLLFHELALEGVAGEHVSTYSFGMKRKLAIAEALAHNPRLVILDEPSIGLDFASRTNLYSLLRSASANGQAVIVSTNDMNEAKYLADRVWLMSEGRIISSGAPEELVRELDRNVMIQVEIGVPVSLERLKGVGGIVNADLHEEGGKLMLRAMVDADSEGSAMGEIVRILSERGVGIRRVDLHRPDLGDVFLKHVKGGSG